MDWASICRRAVSFKRRGYGTRAGSLDDPFFSIYPSCGFLSPEIFGKLAASVSQALCNLYSHGDTRIAYRELAAFPRFLFIMVFITTDTNTTVGCYSGGKPLEYFKILLMNLAAGKYSFNSAYTTFSGHHHPSARAGLVYRYLPLSQMSQPMDNGMRRENISSAGRNFSTRKGTSCYLFTSGR